MKVHHIGYAVMDIDQAIASFCRLGYSIGEKIEDLSRRVVIAFATNGSMNVELIAPLEENSPVDGVLKKNGPMPYHICYQVSSIESAYEELKKDGWRMLIKPAPAPAIQYNGSCAKVAFLYHKNIGLIELVEFEQT